MTRRSLLVLAVGFILPFFANGTVLGTLHNAGIGFVLGQGELPFQLPLQFALAGDMGGTPCWVASPSCIVLLDHVLTAADIGTVFHFNPSSPGFAAAASFLTDGIDDEWSFSLIGGSGGSGLPVSEMFSPGLGPDFVGDKISEIDLSVNNLSFSFVSLPAGPISNPGLMATFTQAQLDMTITVQGTPVPEPPTALLIAPVLAAAAVWRRRLRARGHF